MIKRELFYRNECASSGGEMVSDYLNNFVDIMTLGLTYIVSSV